jgi:hypothetical protein
MGPPPTWRGWFSARWRPGSQATWPAGRVDQPPPTRPSPPCVYAWQPRLGPNRLKPSPAGRPLGPLSLGFGPLGPRIKYTPMVMMILILGQLHFVISRNAPIWYLSSQNQINTKIVELG